jgi:hypothetical protein
MPVTRRVVQQVVRELGDQRDARYRFFFDSLKTPDWVAPLWEAGFFRAAPPPEEREHGTFFPLWVESMYLARVAKDAPAVVARIFLQMPATTNPHVHHDAMAAALVMPPHLAAQIARHEAEWVGHQRRLLFLLPEQYTELVVMLARAHKRSAALDLAAALLAITADEDLPEEWRKAFPDRPRPRTRIDEYEYERAVEKIRGPLVEAAKTDALALLVQLLRDHIRYSRTATMPEGEDYLDIRRPAIEEDEGRTRGGIAETLISAVRDAAVALVEQDNAVLLRVLAVFDAEQSVVFRRLALDLLRRFGALAPKEVGRHLTDWDLFTTRGVSHEFALLARDWFGKLGEDERRTILDRLDRATEEAEVRLWLTNMGQEATPEQVERILRSELYRSLTVLANGLTPAWQERYDALREEFGLQRDPAETVPRSGAVWVGPRSPKNADDLKAMSGEELVTYLREWRTRDIFEASPEGLGRALAAAVAADAPRYSAEAHGFEGLEPVYVRSFLEGIAEGVRANAAIDWLAVLDLCASAVAQPRGSDDQDKRDFETDPHWGWTRGTIARVLQSGCEGRPNAIPFNQRRMVWDIIAVLVEDPDPQGDGLDREGRNSDPATLALNCVRGKAMTTVIQYALWTARHLRESAEPHDLSAMPEVVEVLERHLDPTHERSIGVRAVYGLELDRLVTIDPAWVAAHLTALFPREPALRALRLATWEPYLVFAHPYDNVFRLLRGEYATAADEIAEEPLTRGTPDPRERHAEHLMLFFARGSLDLAEPDRLLERFFAAAPAWIRAHALSFVGRLLQDQGRAAPRPALTRLRRLWEFRLQSARDSTDPGAFTQELAQFGWWYRTAVYEREWALEQVIAVLDLGGEIAAVPFVLEQVAFVASKTPTLALAALRRIVDSASFEMHMARAGYIEQILSEALAHRKTREDAIALIDRLGARGYTHLGELLRTPQRAARE